MVGSRTRVVIVIVVKVAVVVVVAVIIVAKVVAVVAGLSGADIGDVDILVNNAGIVTGKPFLDSPDSLNVKTMEVNTMAHFWTVKAFVPQMLQKDKGHVVTIASTAGLFGAPGLTDYCASKFSAVGFGESLRLEIAKQKKEGVKTTLVCPGFIDTGMLEGFKYRFPLIIPVLKPPYVADRIIGAVLTDQSFLCMPRIMHLMIFIKGFLPVTVVDAMGEFMGLLDTMNDFKGRKQD
ncbi:epidermal retinol dehydrogenase 2-like [Elysia marginata]|uniref:Epidermal retinol dehydrogenase 2-like n=1 Tax=Elysia marginata TaxID=1093978 RepID=A0AAV4FR07_9GAST|nr:epidermal retinol dehydrogenase 2-like [Elysia marginata]